MRNRLLFDTPRPALSFREGKKLSPNERAGKVFSIGEDLGEANVLFKLYISNANLVEFYNMHNG